MEDYEKVDAMEQSIYKNIQELAEFLVLDLGITNVYDLFDKLEELRKWG